MEEAKRLIRESKSDMVRYPHLPDFIELSLATGMRKQEVLQLELSRIDLRHEVIYREVDHQKGKDNSTVPLNAWAKKVLFRRFSFLKEQCPGTIYAFPNLKKGSSGMTTIKDVKNGFAGACERAKVADATPHTLRHTFASWLVQAGVSLYVVKDLLRHKSITQTEVYAHLAPKNRADSVAKLDDLLRESRSGSRSDFPPNQPLTLIDKIALESIG